jgi:hypothetical protein
MEMTRAVHEFTIPGHETEVPGETIVTTGAEEQLKEEGVTVRGKVVMPKAPERKPKYVPIEKLANLLELLETQDIPYKISISVSFEKEVVE